MGYVHQSGLVIVMSHRERNRDVSHPCRVVNFALCLVQWSQDNAESLRICLKLMFLPDTFAVVPYLYVPLGSLTGSVMSTVLL